MLPTILAQNTPQPGGGSPFTLLLLVGIMAVFYLMAVRPQRKAREAHLNVLRTLAVGDEIETIGGLYGVVTRLDDENAWVDLAPGTTVKMARRAVRRKVEAAAPQQEES